MAFVRGGRVVLGAPPEVELFQLQYVAVFLDRIAGAELVFGYHDDPELASLELNDLVAEPGMGLYPFDELRLEFGIVAMIADALELRLAIGRFLDPGDDVGRAFSRGSVPAAARR